MFDAYFGIITQTPVTNNNTNMQKMINSNYDDTIEHPLHSADPDLMEENIPEESTDCITPEDMDIHGKLSHLNAVNLSSLTLNKRYTMITLTHPPYTDELGRFMITAGSYPSLPALTYKETVAAFDGLISDKLIETWARGGSQCYEVAGAYAFKQGLGYHLDQRRKIAKTKKEELEKRRQRKKDAEDGVQFVYEDDGKGSAEDGMIHEKIRTKRGNLVEDRPDFFFSSTVPQRKGKPKHEMIVNQPKTSTGCILRMLPSFNPAYDLNALGAVLRYYLLMEADDFGRVPVDVKKLHGQLGPSITKRVTKDKIQQELNNMARKGHLIIFDRPQGVFGYLRDSAQHLMTKKRYNRQIPTLYTNRNFTYDSKEYLAFFESCRIHTSKRDKVNVGQFCQKGDVVRINEYVYVAAENFINKYKKLIDLEPYCNMSPEEFCGFSNEYTLSDMPEFDMQFWHAIQKNLSSRIIRQIYFDRCEELDKGNSHKIFTYLLKMTPAQYMKQLNYGHEDADECAPPNVPYDEDDPPLIVPWD